MRPAAALLAAFLVAPVATPAVAAQQPPWVAQLGYTPDHVFPARPGPPGGKLLILDARPTRGKCGHDIAYGVTF